MRPSAVIAILSVLPLSAAIADVYRSVDAQGHVLYSDTPTPGAQLIRSGGTHPASPPSAPPAAASKPVKSNEPQPTAAEQQLASRAVQSDLAQTRAEQCKKAQEQYQKAIQARRIYNEGPNGERTYLTDEEADKARVASKLQMDEACKDVVAASE
jgi:hypothetical protein